MRNTSSSAGRRPRRAVKDQDRADARLVLGQAPRRLEEAAGPAPDVFELGLFEADRVDGEPLAHVVEEDGVGAPASVRRRRLSGSDGRASNFASLATRSSRPRYSARRRCSRSRFGLVTRQPRCWSTQKRCARTSRSVRSASRSSGPSRLALCEPLLECRLLLLAESERLLDRFADLSVVEAVVARLARSAE